MTMVKIKHTAHRESSGRATLGMLSPFFLFVQKGVKEILHILISRVHMALDASSSCHLALYPSTVPRGLLLSHDYDKFSVRVCREFCPNQVVFKILCLNQSVPIPYGTVARISFTTRFPFHFNHIHILPSHAHLFIIPIYPIFKCSPSRFD